jgi:DNA-binding response OmpR family regulator
MSDPPRVLIVDDDSSIQQILEGILSDGGFSPQSASTAEEAVSLLNANRYCAVVIDISFGVDHVRGWAVARRARAFSPDLPVIYVTGGNTDEWAIQGVPNSVLITKPFPPVQLITAIAQLLPIGLAPAVGLR